MKSLARGCIGDGAPFAVDVNRKKGFEMGELDFDCDTQEDLDADAAEDERREAVRCYVVAIYLEDRAYGGPEEGGWWYDCGTRCEELNEHLRGFSADARGDARAWVDKLNAEVCAALNDGRPSISSVLSDGRYRAICFENRAPDHFPEVRPHYE